MKKVVITKDGEGYLENNISESSWTIIHCDNLNVRDLSILSKSENLIGKEKLLVFDVSIMKLKKELVDIIKETRHNILIIAEDEKNVPVGIRKICKKEVIGTRDKSDIMNVIGKLGTSQMKIETLKKFPLGQLVKYLNVNWDKFCRAGNTYNLLVEINKRLYKVSDDYLYLYLMYGFPTQNRKTFFRWPSRKKSDMKASIIEKIGVYYSYSSKEVNKMWWLIKKIMNNDWADKYKLSNEERKLLGLKKKDKVEIVKNIHNKTQLKSKSLLEI